MRFEILHPCSGSRAMVLRIRRSRVPWSRSDGLGIDTSMVDNNTSTIDNNQRPAGGALDTRLLANAANPFVRACRGVADLSSSAILEPPRIDVGPSAKE